jgi:hypothetical protein
MNPDRSRGRGLRSTAGLALLAIAIGVLLYLLLNADPAPERDLDASPSRIPALPVVAAPAPLVIDSERAAQDPGPAPPVAAAEPPAPPPIAPVASPSPQRVRGRALQTDGRPIAGVDIVAESNRLQRLATSASDGFFDFELTAKHARLHVSSSEWITLHCAMYDGTARELYVIATPSIALAGRVLGEDGRALADARIAIDEPYDALSEFPLPRHTTNPVGYGTRSGTDGAFAFDAAPAYAKLQLVTSADGYDTDSRALPSSATLDLVIVLRKNADIAEEILGVVVHADGSPAVGASVHFGTAKAVVDERGQFRLALEKWVPPEQALVAAKQGFQAALIEDYSAVVASAQRHPAPVRLVLGAEALSISGTIVGADGEPRSGWIVSLLDPTALAQSVPVPSAERETLGKRVVHETKADGAFTLGGLRARDYRLQAYDKTTLVSLASEPLAAGTQDAVLRVPADALVERIQGRVVARDGKPLAAVHLSVQYVTERSKYGASMQGGSRTQSAEDGSWSLDNVPRRGVSLLVGNDETIPLQYPLDGVDLDRPIVLTPLRRCHFRIENGPTKPQQIGFQVYDAQDRELDLMQIQGNGWMSTKGGLLIDGSCQTLAVSEDAVLIRLHDRGSVVASRALTLVPNEVTVVRF